MELCICKKKKKQTNKQYPIFSGPNGDNLLIYYIATSFIGIQTGLKKLQLTNCKEVIKNKKPKGHWGTLTIPITK